jgi:hypothetical protein
MISSEDKCASSQAQDRWKKQHRENFIYIFSHREHREKILRYFAKRGWHPQPIKSLGLNVVKTIGMQQKLVFFCKLSESISKNT